jgi:hypothetical protein
MWPVTTTPAAKALGVPPANLRRWVRQGKFKEIEGVSREVIPGSFQEKTLFTRPALTAIAQMLKLTPDFSEIEGSSNA